jgi:hypothetical protein
MGIRLKPSRKLTARTGIAINKGGHAQKENRTSFSLRQVTQDDKVRAAIFGNIIGRTVSEKYFDAALAGGAIRPLTEEERLDMSPKERVGGGKRFCMVSE